MLNPDHLETREEIKRGFLRMWNEVGPDVLQNAACEQYGYDINPLDIKPGSYCSYAEEATVSRATVIDVTLDRCRESAGLSDEAKALWETLTYEELIALATKAFPHETYSY